MAATGNVSGINGAVTFAAGYTVKCTAWSLDIAVEDIDITALGSAWRSKRGGIKEWSGSFDCQVNSASLSSMGNFGLGGAASAAKFTFDDVATTDGEFQGSIIITGSTTNVAVGSGATTVTFTFVGSSTLTIQAAA